MTESKRSSVGDALGAAVADCVRSKERAETERAELFAFLMQVPAAIAVRVGADLTCVFQNEASLAIHDERGQPLLVTWPDIPPGCLAGYDRAFAGETHVAREAEATQVWPPGRRTDTGMSPTRRCGGAAGRSRA